MEDILNKRKNNPYTIPMLELTPAFVPDRAKAIADESASIAIPKKPKHPLKPLLPLSVQTSSPPQPQPQCQIQKKHDFVRKVKRGELLFAGNILVEDCQLIPYATSTPKKKKKNVKKEVPQNSTPRSILVMSPTSQELAIQYQNMTYRKQTRFQLDFPRFKRSEVYACLVDRPFNFRSVNYKWELRKRYDFHRYLSKNKVFKKLTSALARMFMEDSGLPVPPTDLNLDERLFDALNAENGIQPIQVQLSEAKEKMDDLVNLVVHLEAVNRRLVKRLANAELRAWLEEQAAFAAEQEAEEEEDERLQEVGQEAHGRHEGGNHHSPSPTDSGRRRPRKGSSNKKGAGGESKTGSSNKVPSSLPPPHRKSIKEYLDETFAIFKDPNLNKINDGEQKVKVPVGGGTAEAQNEIRPPAALANQQTSKRGKKGKKK